MEVFMWVWYNNMFGFATCILNVHKLIANFPSKVLRYFSTALVKWKTLSKENFVAFQVGLLFFSVAVLAVMHNFMYKQHVRSDMQWTLILLNFNVMFLTFLRRIFSSHKLINSMCLVYFINFSIGTDKGCTIRQYIGIKTVKHFEVSPTNQKTSILFYYYKGNFFMKDWRIVLGYSNLIP